MSAYDYQWEILEEISKPEKDINHWICDYGTRVLERDDEGKAKKIRFHLLIDNNKIEVYLVGDFNRWGQDDLERYKLEKDDFAIFGTIETEKIRHKDKYKFLVIDNEKKYFMQDPAGAYFDDEGNTIFWDFEDPNCYKQKHTFIDNFQRSIKIMQTDLPGLIAHFADEKGICGRDIKQKEYFKFITESGVIKEIKRLGFNTIQFLPFAQSIDGDNWKYRYLVPFQFAIQKNWGTPDDFARMIDAFHDQGIGVIGDFVLGHIPHKDFNIFGQPSTEHGLHLWRGRDRSMLYLKEETSWGTMRINFDNTYVRNFFISSCLHFMKYYRIDGFRIDNVDGIIRYGPNGDGDERPNGRTFLKELNTAIYECNPKAMIHYEAHYYYGDNAKMLVAPMESDERALGASAYNSSRVTYYLHTEYMPKKVEDVTVWKFKHISDEKEWGKSNSTVADFHNHDAAAGLMEMRCTGSYAYDAMTHNNPSNHFHAVGKIKAMEGIISFLTEGRTLDLLQTFLLQKGTFEHDSSIQWFLTFNEENKGVVNFKRAVNVVMDDPAFWPVNTKNRKFLNLDDKGKIIVVERSSEDSKYVVVINISSYTHYNYKIGVIGEKNYELILNSDEKKYCGTGHCLLPKEFENRKSNSFELLDREIELNNIGPYAVIVLKEKKDL